MRMRDLAQSRAAIKRGPRGSIAGDLRSAHSWARGTAGCCERSGHPIAGGARFWSVAGPATSGRLPLRREADTKRQPPSAGRCPAWWPTFVKAAV